MKIINVYTSQLYIAGDIPEGFKVIDTTVKTGIRELAPNWDFLMEYKNSDKRPSDIIKYIRRYYEKMQHTLTYFTDLLDKLINTDNLVLCCYCHADKFCHRQLLLMVLSEYAATKGVRINYAGEIMRGRCVRNHLDLGLPPFAFDVLGEIYAKRRNDVDQRPDGDVSG